MRPARRLTLLPRPAAVRTAALGVAVSASLAGCGLLPWGDAAPLDAQEAQSNWRSWEPPDSERTFDYTEGPWDEEGRLEGKRLDACALLTRKEVSSIIPEVTKLARIDESDPSEPGTGTCTFIVNSSRIPSGDAWFGPYTFRLTVTVSRPGVTSRDAAQARTTSEFRRDHTDYGKDLGGKAAWASAAHLWLQASDEVLVDMASVGATNGVGWLASEDEAVSRGADTMNRRWRAAVFTKIAKVVAQKHR